MDTLGGVPPEQPVKDQSLPKNPFVALETLSEAMRLAFFSTPAGKAVQASDEWIRQDLQNASAKDREVGRALAFPAPSRVLQGFLNSLGNHYDWLLALDESFTPFHFMRLVCTGLHDEALTDGWAKFLSLLEFAHLVGNSFGLDSSGIPSSPSLDISQPSILPGEDVRQRVEAVLSRVHLSPAQIKAYEQSLRDQQRKTLNPVQCNLKLLKLLSTPK